MPGVLRKTFAALAVLAAFVTSSAFGQQGEQARFAFVIGNDLYQDAPLPTAANDAGLIADTLKSAGFDVTGARNLDQDTLRSSYREFLDEGGRGRAGGGRRRLSFGLRAAIRRRQLPAACRGPGGARFRYSARCRAAFRPDQAAGRAARPRRRSPFSISPIPIRPPAPRAWR